MPSSSPSIPPTAPVPNLPADSSTKFSAGSLRNSEGAASQAFARTLERKINLSLRSEGVTDPEQEGRTRLRGAFSIAITRIRPDPEQPRREFDEVQLRELAASIRERGVRQPIRVFYHPDDKIYQIVSGERRFRASRLAGLPSIPCIVDDITQPTPLVRKTIIVDQLVENWQRTDLNAYELHDALVTLRDTHGMTQDEIVQLTGKPKSEVSRLISLGKIKPELQEQLRQDTSGGISKRHLQAIARVPEDQQEAFVAEVREANLTAVEAERSARRKANAKRGSPGNYAGGTVRRFAVPGATVAINFRRKEVSEADVLEVLEKVRQMVEERTS